jgi:hypothetical protein
MATRQQPTADPAALRERAAQCLDLARKAPSWVDTEVLRRIAGGYLRLAERLEREARERVATPPALTGSSSPEPAGLFWPDCTACREFAQRHIRTPRGRVFHDHYRSYGHLMDSFESVAAKRLRTAS